MKRVLILVLALSCSIARADVLTRTGPDYIEDTFLDEPDPTANRASADSVLVRNGTYDAHPIIRFKNLGLPSGAVIDSAKFIVTVKTTNTDGPTYIAYLVIPNVIVDQCTWTIYRVGQPWDQPGALGVNTDYDPSALTMGFFSGTSGQQFTLLHGSAFTDAVRRYGDSSFAVIIHDQGSTPRQISYWSTEALSSLRPVLKVWYHMPAGAGDNQGALYWWF
jgi:hypothetical protein